MALKKGKTEFFIKPEHQVEVAFTQNGIEYMQFVDSFKIPSSRSLVALDFYRALQMGCDVNFLKKHTAAHKKITGDRNSIDIGKLALMNLQLEERVNYIKPKELYLDLASVLYFDHNENPYDFEREYAEKKKDLWREDQAVLDFFLCQLMPSLLPYLKQSGVSSLNYFHEVEKINQMHLDTLSSILSKGASMTGPVKQSS